MSRFEKNEAKGESVHVLGSVTQRQRQCDRFIHLNDCVRQCTSKHYYRKYSKNYMSGSSKLGMCVHSST